jgi:prevent-host-death family protein
MPEITESSMGVREARQAFADRVARAQYGDHVTVVTKHGVEAAMLIPPVPAELRARLMELLAQASKARKDAE